MSINFSESRPVREPRRHSGEPGDHAGHGQDRQSGVRLHRRGPDRLVQADGRAGRKTGGRQRRNQRHVRQNTLRPSI